MLIRALTRSEVDSTAVAWARLEGWNPGLHDAEIFARAYPEAFVGAEIDGRIVATLSATRYGDDFAFVGFYIVEPEYRGRGIGREIWTGALDRHGHRNVGLDGVVAQIENYRRSGFAIDYHNRRYRGIGGGKPSGMARPARAADIAAIVAYDERCFPGKRSEFVERWVMQPGAFAYVIDGWKDLSGYAVMRPCFEGWKIGPLFADDRAGAQALLDDLCARIPGDNFYLDVPTIHHDAIAIVTRAKMDVVFETARMYTRGRPQFSVERCFGVTTFELG